MEEKVSVVTIIVSDYTKTERVNALLSEYRDYIVGRFGLPVKEKNISVISVVMLTDAQRVNSLSGKLGMIEGISSKVLTAK